MHLLGERGVFRMCGIKEPQNAKAKGRGERVIAESIQRFPVEKRLEGILRHPIDERHILSQVFRHASDGALGAGGKRGEARKDLASQVVAVIRRVGVGGVKDKGKLSLLKRRCDLLA